MGRAGDICTFSVWGFYCHTDDEEGEGNFAVDNGENSNSCVVLDCYYLIVISCSSSKLSLSQGWIC